MRHIKFSTVLGTLSLLLLGHTCFAQTASPYNVRDFGATGDGKTKDTAALQKALDTCAVNGGGEVVVPAGNYLTGSVQIGNRTILRLEKDATLTQSSDADDFPMMDIRWEGRWLPGHRALIYAASVDHIGIVGPGHIAGSPAMGRLRNPRGPVLIEPISCKDVRLEDFSTQFQGLWSIHPTYCENLVARGLTIRSTGGQADGIDIDSCDGVRVDTCDIATGDDSIGIKSGRGMDGARIGKPCQNILITNCTLADSIFACIGMGSETSGDFRNIRIQHCKFTSQTFAVYIKSRVGRAGIVENISGDDLDVLGGGFLRINLQTSGSGSTVDDAVPGNAGIPQGRNFSFSNVRVKCTTLVDASLIPPEKPVQGLSLSNITGTCDKAMTLVNINNAALKDINVTGFTGPLLATRNTTGTGLEAATPYTAPPPAPARPARGPGGANAARGVRGTTAPATAP